MLRALDVWDGTALLLAFLIRACFISGEVTGQLGKWKDEKDAAVHFFISDPSA